METIQKDVALRAADNIRVLVAAMVEEAASGHPGGAMGGADYLQLLFSEYLVYDPEDPNWFFRDRFFLDPGHMSAMLYGQLCLTGDYSLDDLKGFRQWGSVTPGHPEVDVTRRIENTSGPLGQGHANGAGAAIAERFLAHRFGEWSAHKTYAFISDGGIQEEISQGVGRLAGFLGLSNFIMFFDSNKQQLSSPTGAVTEEDTAMKYRAWGWAVHTVDGHDYAALRGALDAAQKETQRPTLIIGDTTMGKGAVDEAGNPREADYTTHGKPLSKAKVSYEETVKNLGGDPENAFRIYDDVAEYYKEVRARKAEQAAARREGHEAWAAANPEQAKKLQGFIDGDLSHLDLSEVEQKPDAATRNASAQVLSYLADHMDNLIVASADLSDSDKTEAFLKKRPAFEHGDFSGAFIQMGVSELTMGAVANGLILHGGVRVACGTFFVFSDFMKPAVRLAALMETPVIYIWTHDAFRVGEDGPTHQPVEQEAQIRLLEQLKNHAGHDGVRVLRPADADETTVCWQMALENTDTPTALILSRQNIPSLPGPGSTPRKEAAQAARKGAYVVIDADDPQLIMVANGSEVGTLHEGLKLLKEQRPDLRVRLVSAPSEGLFRRQSAEYQQEVLPPAVPTLGMTAGLPSTLAGLVGPGGRVFGLEHFGHSAPYQVLDEKLGFTAEHVVQLANDYLAERG
ncbi:MAG: transketolase [Catalinimonas sp.]